jgi:hypothetical protein
MRQREKQPNPLQELASCLHCSNIPECSCLEPDSPDLKFPFMILKRKKEEEEALPQSFSTTHADISLDFPYNSGETRTAIFKISLDYLSEKCAI